MVWDFAEANTFSESSGSFIIGVDWVCRVLKQTVSNAGQVEQSSATEHPLPNDSASAFISDPPYYDAVPYADLSDFFYVWLKRALSKVGTQSDATALTSKANECIVDASRGKDRFYFEQAMAQAMAEGRRVLHPSGIGIIVFAHKSTSGWEAQLQAMVNAGWTMTGSWPIDTEMGTRLRAQDSGASRLPGARRVATAARLKGITAIGWKAAFPA